MTSPVAKHRLDSEQPNHQEHRVCYHCLSATTLSGVWPVPSVGALVALMGGQDLLWLTLAITETPTADLVVSFVRSSDRFAGELNTDV